MLQFYDPERAVSEQWWFPLQSLRVAEATKPEIQHASIYSNQVDQSAILALRQDLLAAEMRLGWFSARNAIISLLGNWSPRIPFSLDSLGGSLSFLKLLRLIAKAHLTHPIPELDQASNSDNIMRTLWAHLYRLLRSVFYWPKALSNVF